jgi:hypothetical protein
VETKIREADEDHSRSFLFSSWCLDVSRLSDAV